ncbi:MAG: sulfatase-like hydrolase/transferase, partial [Bacteroides ovatus]|nr:sulfatase-like hydrolase/transferase [Bacteroides ovatus]
MLPLISGQAQKQDSPSKTPNVVFIMADDLGIGDLGCYGQNRIKTPAIDALAAQGMKFTQHYSGSTVSAPSRCVLLTGKHTG